MTEIVNKFHAVCTQWNYFSVKPLKAISTYLNRGCTFSQHKLQKAENVTITWLTLSGHTLVHTMVCDGTLMQGKGTTETKAVL